MECEVFGQSVTNCFLVRFEILMVVFRQAAQFCYSKSYVENEVECKTLFFTAVWKKTEPAKKTVEIAKYLNITPSSYFRQHVIRRLVDDQYLSESRKGRTSFYRTNHQKVERK